MSSGRRELTDEQKAVVRHTGGHALISAAPGSGKTTVLIARLRTLVRTGADATQILALMFNKSAQLGFQARLRRAIGDNADIPDVRTFHSIGKRVLDRLVALGALPRERLITSSRAFEAMARKALKEAWRKSGRAGAPTQDQYQGFFQFVTLVKSQLDTAQHVFREGAFNSECQPFIPAFSILMHLQVAGRVVYFDDLIYRPMIYLRDNPAQWQQFTNQYEEILVDELQDVNEINFYMVEGLAGTRARVVGCGDARQSIYGFRGARVSLMTHDFAATFSPCTKYPMSRTFRFGHEIALFANHVIQLSKDKEDSLVVASNDNPRTRIERRPMRISRDSGLVDLVAPYEGAGKLHDCMMLARNFSHLVPFEIELAEAGIPFHVYGREGLLFLPEIATLVCAVSLVANRWIIEPEDREHFIFSLLTTPTPFVQYELLAEVAEEMVPHLEGDDRRKLPSILSAVSTKMRSSNPRGAAHLDDRVDALKLLTGGSLSAAPAATIVKAYIAMTKMEEILKRGAATPAQATESLATLGAFVKLAERSGSTENLLDVLGPMAALKGEKPPEGDHLGLTTLHRSKGLEWPMVMLVGLTSGIFPSAMPDTDAEEERRLFFVGATRAVDRLILFHPEDPTLERTIAEPQWHVGKQDARGASSYLYDGDLASVQAAAQLLEAGQMGSLTVRQDRALTAYVAAVDGHIAIELTEQAKEQAKRESKAQYHGRIPKGYKPREGEELYHPDHGACAIAQVLYAPVCMMRSLATDERFTAVIDHENEWVIPMKLAPQL